jgi:hypothetical protein
MTVPHTPPPPALLSGGLCSIYPSIYLSIPISETSLIPRSLAHSVISELPPILVPCDLRANLYDL